MSTILVTGGRGGLGTHLIPRLIAAGHTVRSASRTLPGANADPRVEWLRADLATGEGLAEAVRGVDVIAHLASAGLGDSRAVDVEGTRRLLDLARQEGVRHFLYISIVGIQLSAYPYYQRKLEAERLIETSGVPYTILRAAQFHSLIDAILNLLTRYPIAVVDPGWTLQPIDEAEVADRMAELVAAGPSGRAPDIAGPEIRKMRDLTRAWLAARGMKRLVIPAPFPGALWSLWRRGGTTLPDDRYGSVTWEAWLARRYGSEAHPTPAVHTLREARK